MLFYDCSEPSEVEYIGTHHSVVNSGIRTSKAQPKWQAMSLDPQLGISVGKISLFKWKKGKDVFLG